MQNDTDPLIKEVPGHLFSFEDKVFGLITINQLLSDIGAGVGILGLTESLHFLARLLIGLFLFLVALILIHGRAESQPLISWLASYVRFLFVAKHTTWNQGDTKTASIQTTWIELDSLEHGIAGYSESGTKGHPGRYWAMLECEGHNAALLPREEQISLYGHYETFLCGLDFRPQFITHVEQVRPDEYEPLRMQKEALAHLVKTPRLAKLQRASIHYQERHIQHCTTVRHFVVVSISTQEEMLLYADGETPGVLPVLWHLLFKQKRDPISREQVLNHLRNRIDAIKALMRQLDVQTHLLNDEELLRHYVTCLSLGMPVPSFVPEQVSVDTPTLETEDEPTRTEEVSSQPNTSEALTFTTHPRLTQNEHRHLYKKCVKGVHAKSVYTNSNEQCRFEAGAVNLANLVSPTRIDISPTMIEYAVRGTTRYACRLSVYGYGTKRACGWVGDLTKLGLPLSISLAFDPLDTQSMINRLEMQQVRLASRRIGDAKTQSSGGSAVRNEEYDQIRAVTKELAARRMRVFAVQMTIGISAGSPERLKQRTQYLLAHLRRQQLQVRVAKRRQDKAWQASLPTCPPTDPSASVNVPSTVLSSFLHLSSGRIGTPTGAFLGFTGAGASRYPVFFDPWSEELSAPHVIIIGKTGQGKSFVGKTCVTGLMGLGIADVVVLDKDDDYKRLHTYLGPESQRYDLAGGCPINLFDLPYTVQDIDLDDPSDLIGEFLDNQLLVAFTLLVCNPGEQLSKSEEAYLMHVARAVYAEWGFTGESIRHTPDILLNPMPTLSDFVAAMKAMPASSEGMRASLVERFEKPLYLFSGQTRVNIEKPLTVFSIRHLNEKWYALMTFTVQSFLMRHRALRRNARYLAYVVEEASFLLKHPAGRKYLENASRGFRKLGIAQFTLSQNPQEFLSDGAVMVNNCGAALYLGMQHYVAQDLRLPEELERVVTSEQRGQAVFRVGNEYAPLTIATSRMHQTIFTTKPQDEKKEIERSRAA